MSKLTMLATFGVGYVLGAKAGRDRYEEIMAAAGKVRGNPQVQRATETVKAQAPVVADKVKESAGQAADKVRDKADEVRDSGGDAPTAGFNEQPPAGPPPTS